MRTKIKDLKKEPLWKKYKDIQPMELMEEIQEKMIGLSLLMAVNVSLKKGINWELQFTYRTFLENLGKVLFEINKDGRR